MVCSYCYGNLLSLSVALQLASIPGRLKIRPVFFAWVLVHMRDTMTQNLGNRYYDHKTLVNYTVN